MDHTFKIQAPISIKKAKIDNAPAQSVGQKNPVASTTRVCKSDGETWLGNLTPVAPLKAKEKQIRQQKQAGEENKRSRRTVKPKTVQSASVSLFYKNPYFKFFNKSMIDLKVAQYRYFCELHQGCGGFITPDDPDVFKAMAFGLRQHLYQILTNIIYNAHMRCIDYTAITGFKANNKVKDEIAAMNEAEMECDKNVQSNENDTSVELSLANETALHSLGKGKSTEITLEAIDAIAWMEEDEYYSRSGLLNMLYYKME